MPLNFFAYIHGNHERTRTTGPIGMKRMSCRKRNHWQRATVNKQTIITKKQIKVFKTRINDFKLQEVLNQTNAN